MSPRRMCPARMRSWRDDAFYAADLRIRETAGLPRRAGHHMNSAVGEDERHCQIIAYALCLEFGQYRKIGRTSRIGEPPPDGTAGLIDPGDRVF